MIAPSSAREPISSFRYTRPSTLSMVLGDRNAAWATSRLVIPLAVVRWGASRSLRRAMTAPRSLRSCSSSIDSDSTRSMREHSTPVGHCSRMGRCSERRTVPMNCRLSSRPPRHPPDATASRDPMSPVAETSTDARLHPARRRRSSIGSMRARRLTLGYRRVLDASPSWQERRPGRPDTIAGRVP